MTREADIQQALSLGANYIGFIVYPKSPRALTLERAVELSALVPKEQRVLVDVEANLNDIERYQTAGFDYFQMHVNVLLDRSRIIDYSSLIGHDYLWLAPRLAPSMEFPVWILEYAKTIVLDTYSKSQVGGTGHTGDFERFAQLKKQFTNIQWVLAGGLSPLNIKAAINRSTTTHVDVNSGVESAPGKKDPEKLSEFFQAIARSVQ